MKHSLSGLPAPPRVSTLLLDSNLLLVLAIGRIAAQRLGRDSRLKAYSSVDYQILHRYSAIFPARVTTPHILAEVSNHLDNIDPRLLPALTAALSDWTPMQESWIPAATLVTRCEYPEIGLTDTAIVRAAHPRTLVLTADRELWSALAKRQLNALYYADIVRH
jgi:hypothetical protein